MLNKEKVMKVKQAGKYLLLVVISVIISVSILKITDRREDAVQIDTVKKSDMPPVSFAGYKQVESFNNDFTSAAAVSVHAVVHIETEFTQKSSVYDYFFDLRDIFGDRYIYPRQRERIFKASGSGVIITTDGYIVTNNHVVQEADKIIVTLNDRRKYVAKIIGTDPSTDIALIKIEEKNLPFLAYGNSDDVKVGEWVLAVGNPFNLTSTVTAGIVSAKARDINILGKSTGSDTPIESFIQTDAAINPGNSGGALVDVKGRLIGINAAIASGTGHYEGYSFAIPINIVKKVINDLINYGEVQRAYLGVSIRNIDSEFAKENNIKRILGVYIVSVEDNDSNEESCIKPGDIIYKINNKDINNTSELLEAIGQHNPGDIVKIYIKRGNKDKSFNITLKNRNGNTKILKNDRLIILGATIEPVSKNRLNKYGVSNGFEITDLKAGVFKDNGIKRGFIITKINNKTLYSINDIKKILTEKRGGVLIEGFYSNGIKAYYGIGL